MTTILQRLTAAGLSEERARQHLASGYVRVGRDDGRVVEDSDVEVDPADPIRLQPESVTEHQSRPA